MDFSSFLAVTEPGTFTEGANGEITFASRDALASVVASFTFTKLREMAAAAKALARYVDDLESELEASDDLVVEVRAEMYTSLLLATRCSLLIPHYSFLPHSSLLTAYSYHLPLAGAQGDVQLAEACARGGAGDARSLTLTTDPSPQP